MRTHDPPRRSPLYAVLCGVLIAITVPALAALAQNAVTNRGVQKRMDTMTGAKGAVEVLADMMGGRIRFDGPKARTARRDLIKATRSIAPMFSKPHSDPLSQARPDIWENWNDFKIRADTANRAARRLNVHQLSALRATLPDMINACLACHRSYRRPG